MLLLGRQEQRIAINYYLINNMLILITALISLRSAVSVLQWYTVIKALRFSASAKHSRDDIFIMLTSVAVETD